MTTSSLANSLPQDPHTVRPVSDELFGPFCHPNRGKSHLYYALCLSKKGVAGGPEVLSIPT